MTGEEFVRLCFSEKQTMLREYCTPDSETKVGALLRELMPAGTDWEKLRELLDTVMTESWYTMLLALDGSASLGGEQMTYELRDEDGNLLNECGELEAAAWDVFMEKRLN